MRLILTLAGWGIRAKGAEYGREECGLIGVASAWHSRVGVGAGIGAVRFNAEH